MIFTVTSCCKGGRLAGALHGVHQGSMNKGGSSNGLAVLCMYVHVRCWKLNGRPRIKLIKFTLHGRAVDSSFQVKGDELFFRECFYTEVCAGVSLF